MTTDGIIAQFEADGDRLAGPAGPRKEALARFAELGLPGRRQETWRYTDLSGLDRKGFRFIAAEPDATVLDRTEAALRELNIPADGPRCVFVDGFLSDRLSLLPENSGIELAEDTASDPDDTSALAALTLALSPGHPSLRVSKDSAETIEIIFVCTGNLIASQVSLRMELEQDATTQITQRFIDLDEAEQGWLNLVLDVNQQPGSHLTLYRLQGHGSERYQTTLNRVRLGESASFTAGNIESGGRLIRNEYEIAMDGPGARTDIFGLALTQAEQHCDFRIAVDHRAPDTQSRQNYRAIVSDSSRSVFNGKVTVQQDAQHIDARQQNDNLLLSSTAEVDTKPELEIYADQVVCSHGATVGELDEDHLFYLRARGIDAEAARGILTAAFAEVILERFEPADIRAAADMLTGPKLPGSENL